MHAKRKIKEKNLHCFSSIHENILIVVQYKSIWLAKPNARLPRDDARTVKREAKEDMRDKTVSFK